jgi:nicotinamidase-related amidase
MILGEPEPRGSTWGQRTLRFMPIPRLRLTATALLVIDVQERLMPTIHHSQRLAGRCAAMLRLAGNLGIPALVTEQNPAGLGRTVDEVAMAMADPSQRVEKSSFSALVDIVDQRLRVWGRSTVLVCGVEAHVCVLQTVLDLQASGRQAFVLSDAVSAGDIDQIPPSFRRMERAGAFMTGIVSATYELLGDFRHPRFRECLAVIKALRD